MWSVARVAVLGAGRLVRVVGELRSAAREGGGVLAERGRRVDQPLRELAARGVHRAR